MMMSLAPTPPTTMVLVLALYRQDRVLNESVYTLINYDVSTSATITNNNNTDNREYQMKACLYIIINDDVSSTTTNNGVGVVQTTQSIK